MGFLKNHPVVLLFAVIFAVVVGFTVDAYLRNLQQATSWGGGGAVLVATAAAEMTMLVDVIESIGTAQANESVNLSPKVTDTVSRVNFDDGDFVAAGTILVELTNNEQTAMLAEAKATLDETTRQLDRIQNLIARNLASELQLDGERARHQTATARFEAIVARLDDRLIRAPFSGILGFRNVSTGSLLSPGTIVTTLDDVSVIKLNFSIAESYLAAVKAGQQVTARSIAYPDITFTGKVTAINSRVDPVTRAIGIRALLANEEQLLRPGMLLTVRLAREGREALVVPEEAIVPVQDKEFVFTISAENTAQRLEVQTGRRRPGVVEVLSGLSAGQEVITQGIIKIRPGDTVVRETSS